MRVLAVATYPELAAATRYRLLQYVPHLREEGIDVDVRPFLSNAVFATMYDRRHAMRTAGGVLAGMGRRIVDWTALDRYDAVFVQREAALVGPAGFEWLTARRRPLVLDLDDSTYIERRSEVFGPLARWLKFHGKTERMIRWARHVVCGNPTIARHVELHGVPTTVLPTIVDVDVFRPAVRSNERLTIGWIGTHSTYPYLRTLFPVLRRLAQHHQFRLKVIGAGRVDPVEGVDVEFVPWRLEEEVPALQSFDVGLYPIIEDAWAEGKSGFKSIQYLSCGLPFVATPVGVVRDLGIPGRTHFEARDDGQWYDAISKLLSDPSLRQRMGDAGREYATAQFSVQRSAGTIAAILRSVVGQQKGR